MSQLSQNKNAPASGYGLTHSHALRVVVADDEVLPAELLKRMLLRLGHAIVGTAQNGMEAVTLVRELRPDVVLMDLRMPVMDGWTATAELAQDMISPVVVVSALDDHESLEQAVSAGASAFLTKPVREDDLERALESAVARFADLQEIRKWRADAEQRALEQTKMAEELAQVLFELRETQLHLVTAARRAAIASLARSLTHEINNALTPIVGSAQMISILHPNDAETVERTRQIVEHAQRIAGWTAVFRQISMGPRKERIPFSFNGIIQDVVNLYAERFARMGITMTVVLDEELPPMQGYPEQLQEMFMNLFQNAADLLRAGGTLEVRTEYLAAREMVLATLTDSGPGIAADDLMQMSLPELNALSAGESNLGWGLFTAREIIKAHLGEFEVTSPLGNDGRGTQMRMRLPLDSGMAA